MPRAPLWLVATASALSPGGKLFVGLNKYSHNACVCVIDDTGRVVFAGEKERLTRVKNDGGAVGDLVRHALAACGSVESDVAVVAQNNHHASVAADESAYDSAAALGLAAPFGRPPVEDVLDPANRLPDAVHVEVSHHLAHAYGALAADQFPREGGVVVVLDGMGEKRARFSSSDVTCDAGLVGWEACRHVLNDEAVADFADVPFDARECESVYAVTDERLRPLWKRWCRERASPFDYADWFLEPMDSLGAAYSHVSHVIFGHWNACGKVMGLAPWGAAARVDDDDDDDGCCWGQATRASWGRLASCLSVDAIVEAADGALISCRGAWESGFRVDRSATRRVLERACEALPRNARDALVRASGGAFPPAVEANLWNRFSSEEDSLAADAARACCAVLAAATQRQLEDAALPLLHEAARQTKGGTLYLTGGVALNSVLNGKLEEESSLEVVVPSAPGDEGVALGCAALAFVQDDSKKKSVDATLLPFAGAPPAEESFCFDFEEDELAVEWLEPVSDADVVEACAEAIAKEGAIVFWFQGRAEFGPRALGHRSILASAADARVVDYLNEFVKCREDFRPLAPSILEEAADDVFFRSRKGRSPYMSKVWQITPSAAKHMAACRHVDGSARPQTVSERADLATYRNLLRRVGELSGGPPVVLDTSFNTKRAEPIVESVAGAVASFVHAAARRPSLSSAKRRRPHLLAFPDQGKLFRPRECPVDEDGSFPEADSSRPRRRHDFFEISERRIRVLDLDEPLEDAELTGRGDYALVHDLDALVYKDCDGARSARDIASRSYDDGAVVTEDEVFCSLRRLWLASLVVLGPPHHDGEYTCSS